MRFRFIGLLQVAFCVGGMSGPAAGGPVDLYDVSFSSPPHTVGEVVVTGLGPPTRETPSQLPFGLPIVVESFGPLDDQPLRLAPDSQNDIYDQVAFDVWGSNGFPIQHPEYLFSMDLVLDQLVPQSNLTVLFDSPLVRNIYFRDDGTIRYRVSSSDFQTIGSFAFGQAIHLGVHVDRFAEEWTITLDGQVLHHGDFAANSLRSVRVSMEGFGSVGAIDNVRIVGIPAPGSLYAGLACGILIISQRRRRTSYSHA